MIDYQHKPVLADEVINNLNIQADKVYVDGTLGGGGHSNLILKNLNDQGKLFSFDQDREAITRNQEQANAVKNWILVNQNFASIEDFCLENQTAVNGGLLLDLGLSSIQLDDPRRGFNFDSEAPLDMRLNPDAELTAEEVVNTYPEKAIADILYIYGEEFKSRQIAKAIVNKRPFKTCKELANLIKNFSAKQSDGRSFRIHPATKSFQGLRIYVNKELEVLEKVLDINPAVFTESARILVISFHSLEDRIVKQSFKKLEAQGIGAIVTKKPITASAEELAVNPRSRSAKLRVFELGSKAKTSNNKYANARN